jgi:hypothetical protein
VSAARKRAPAPSTALTKRLDDKLAKLSRQVAVLKARAVEVLPAEPTEVSLPKALESLVLSEVAQLGQIGLHPLELSEKAEAVLSEAPVDERVLILPGGAVYYPHIEYTRWFNRAFGRGAWSAVPVATPKLTPKRKEGQFLVTQPFVLYVHGKPVAQATAEGAYFENNAEQTQADVIEALNASALRRLAKRLGIGLELWDRAWGRAWQARFAVQVWVEGENRPQWRRKDDPPFLKERGPAKDRSPQGGPGGEPGGASEPRERGAREPQATDNRKITKGTKEKPGQVERLWAIAKNAGRKPEEIKGYLRIKLGVESTGDVLRRDYEQVIKDIQKPGPMIAVVVDDGGGDVGREPGMEG